MLNSNLFFHKETDSLDIWFDDPEKEASCDEIGEGIVLKKNSEGEVIGIEKLYVSKTLGVTAPIPVEILMA